MDLISIFVDEETGQGLYSIRYKDGKDEFSRLISLWKNNLYVTDYCYKNKEYILTEYFEGYSIDEIIQKILTEAKGVEKLLLEYADGGFDNSGKSLQHLFRPLHDSEDRLYYGQESKGSIIRNEKLSPIIRLYAIRISENAYVISGGAIKLVKPMQDHKDTLVELKKLNKTKRFLIENGFETVEDLKLIL